MLPIRNYKDELLTHISYVMQLNLFWGCQAQQEISEVRLYQEKPVKRLCFTFLASKYPIDGTLASECLKCVLRDQHLIILMS